MRKRLPRTMAAYRRHIAAMVRNFQESAAWSAQVNGPDDWYTTFCAACVPDYEHLLTLDRRQLRRLRRTGGAYL